MDKAEILGAIKELPFTDLVQVCIMDDFYMFLRTWPAIVFMGCMILLIILAQGYRE